MGELPEATLIVDLRTTEKLKHRNLAALSPDIVKEYFDTLKPILEKNHLMKLPWQLKHCDETFFPHEALTLKNTNYMSKEAQQNFVLCLLQVSHSSSTPSL